MISLKSATSLTNFVDQYMELISMRSKLIGMPLTGDRIIDLWHKSPYREKKRPEAKWYHSSMLTRVYSVRACRWGGKSTFHSGFGAADLYRSGALLVLSGHLARSVYARVYRLRPHTERHMYYESTISSIIILYNYYTYTYHYNLCISFYLKKI